MATPDEFEVRLWVYELVKHGDETWSRRVWDAWKAAGGPTDKVRAMGIIHRVLRRMEQAGEIAGRNVTAEEHGESQCVRRYFRKAWKDDARPLG